MGKDNMVSAPKPYVIYPNKLSDRGAFDIVILIFNHNIWNLADCINSINKRPYGDQLLWQTDLLVSWYHQFSDIQKGWHRKRCIWNEYFPEKK